MIYDFRKIDDYNKFKYTMTATIFDPTDEIYISLDVAKKINFNLSNSTIPYNEYKGGYYLGDDLNPYLFFVRPKDKNLEEIVIPEETRYLGKGASPRFANIKRLIVNALDVEIGDSFLSNSSTLEYIEFNGSADIGSNAFSSDKQLKKVVFSNDGFYKIQSYAFYGDELLEEFDLPKNILYLAPFAFSGCPFKKIYVPKNIKDICDVFPNDVEIFYEGDGKELLIRQVTRYVETPDDYAFNFHRSAGSFNYSYGGTDDYYAVEENHHSFVKREDYIPNVKK